MSVIIPEGLQRGDLVGIAAPGSPTTDPATVDRAVDFLSSEGFKVRCPAHIRKRLGYLAGNDAERCADLHELFDDRDVKAIFCLRGGYGCGRLLPLIDYELIGANPKWLIGYSDVTALQMAFFHRCHLASLHGPLLDGKFLSFAQNHRSWMDLMQSLTNPGSERVFQIEGGEVIRPGKAEGILLGGNLSIIHSMAGSGYCPEVAGAILFLEEVGEAPYRIDRMLTSLLNLGWIQKAAGIAIGHCSQCDDRSGRAEYRQSAADVFRERLGNLGVPVSIGFSFGHVEQNLTLMVGAQATLENDRLRTGLKIA